MRLTIHKNSQIPTFWLTSVVLAASLAACASGPKYPDVRGSIRDGINRSGLKYVSVDQDRLKGVITLGGHVANANEKMQAEAVAKSQAPDEVVSNQVAVLPPGDESAAKSANADLDKAIEKNLDAAFIQSNLRQDSHSVNYDVKNGVVTLRGEALNSDRRAAFERVAASVPNVTQVVNELQLKNTPASSTR